MYVDSKSSSKYNTISRLYIAFNENMHNDKDKTAHIEFINRLYNKTNNENGAFQIRGIDMHDFVTIITQAMLRYQIKIYILLQ